MNRHAFFYPRTGMHLSTLEPAWICLPSNRHAFAYPRTGMHVFTLTGMHLVHPRTGMHAFALEPGYICFDTQTGVTFTHFITRPTGHGRRLEGVMTRHRRFDYLYVVTIVAQRICWTKSECAVVCSFDWILFPNLIPPTCASTQMIVHSNRLGARSIQTFFSHQLIYTILLAIPLVNECTHTIAYPAIRVRAWGGLRDLLMPVGCGRTGRHRLTGYNNGW